MCVYIYIDIFNPAQMAEGNCKSKWLFIAMGIRDRWDKKKERIEIKVWSIKDTVSDKHHQK